MDSESIQQPISGLTSTVSHPNNHNQLANSPPSSTISGSSYRNNEVRSVMLYGIPIIALVMDSQERLCLAQISNTLLKRFSYNEIHNRRVALGITCVQCTPVQLELLRRAGAMPVSSRRCGMITKREAERLCKSFLAETAPPKLPDSFSFDVYHQCAWGSRGSFTPSRYNSSRAKCIKCVYCGLFFSPNKFIFHSHRLPDSKYIQPDAANFNSWRRHIKLVGNPEPPDNVSFAWEDVKAMFNGGSRKRAMAASLGTCSRGNSTSHQEFLKRQSLNSSSPESTQSLTPNTTMSDSLSPKSTTSAGPTYFPLIPLPNKCYSLPSTASFSANASMQSSPMKALSSGHASDFRQSFAEFMWVGSGKPPALHIPYSCLLWPRPPTGSLEFGASEANRTKLLFGGSDTNSFMFSHQQREPHWAQDSLHDRMSDNRDTNNNTTQTHTSAFKPVAKAAIGKVSPNSGNDFEAATRSPDNVSPSPEPSHTASDDNDPEVDIIGEDGDESTFNARREDNSLTFESEKQDFALNRKNKNFLTEAEGNSERKRTKLESVNRQEDIGLNFLGQLSDKTEGSVEERNNKTSAINMSSTALDLRNLTTLSREELHQILIKQSEARMRSEREYDVMRETLEQQVRKEMVYREEVAKQLHLVRDALCQELDQERKARLTAQHKLKESQEALQQITYKMVTNNRHCDDFELKSLLHHYNSSH